MTISKKSQQTDFDGFSVPADDLFDLDGLLPPVDPPNRPVNFEPDPMPRPKPQPVMPEEFAPDPMPVEPGVQQDPTLPGIDEEEFVVREDEQDAEAELMMVEETPTSLVFTLPTVPGGEDQDDLEDPSELEVDEDESIVIESDPWYWEVPTFLEWLSQMMCNIPRHSGRDTAGLERAIAHLEAIDREISKAVRSDKNGEIDISKVEEARDELYNGIIRLQERLEKVQSSKYPKKNKGKKKGKNKKKAEAEHAMVKGAKATHVGGITVTVPLLISHVARTCINSMVSAGKDIEDTFDKLASKFEFTPREEAEAMQLLADMGYPMRRPRGYHRDEEIDYTDTDNYDWIANYPA